MLEGTFQAQIDALTEQRKTLYRQKRDGRKQRSKSKPSIKRCVNSEAS